MQNDAKWSLPAHQLSSKEVVHGCSHSLHNLCLPLCRPGVIISFLIGGIVAMLCAMAYMEFAAETRTAGASIVYTSKVFGKLVAW
jgi:amino acid transporter